MIRRSLTLLSVLFAVAMVASPSALAAPQGASTSGYHSVFENATQPLTSPRFDSNGVSIPDDTYKCTEPGYLWSYYNGLFVSTELGYSGNQWAMLRAHATSVGPWEVYQLCQSNEKGTWSLWSNAALGGSQWSLDMAALNMQCCGLARLALVRGSALA
jgi:hypothetical protein